MRNIHPTLIIKVYNKVLITNTDEIFFKGVRMKIVVLDGYAANPGDLDWSELESLGDTVIYDRTPADKIVEVSKDADIVIGNKAVLSADILSKMTNLKYIGLLSTGYNVVDIDYCKSKNIPVCNVPAYSTPSVAQHTLALLLEVCGNVGMHSQSVREGDWCKKQDFCYWNKDVIELSGKTIGIVGFGSIGKEVAKIASALNMNVLAYSRSVFTPPDHVRRADMQQLFAESDIISLHCPMNKESDKLINKNTIALMKDGAIIINTSRGGLIDEQAVREALDTGKLKAFCADVLSTEPPSQNNPLLTSDKAIITPHIAWASIEARSRLLKVVCANIRSFINGEPLANNVAK